MPAGSFATMTTYSSSACTGSPAFIEGYNVGVCVLVAGGSAVATCDGDGVVFSTCTDNACQVSCDVTPPQSGCSSGVLLSCGGSGATSAAAPPARAGAAAAAGAWLVAAWAVAFL